MPRVLFTCSVALMAAAVGGIPFALAQTAAAAAQSPSVHAAAAAPQVG